MDRRTLRGVRNTVAWSLTLALLLAGCGSGVESPRIDGLGQVAAAAEAAGSARLAFRMDMTLMGQSFGVVGEGVADLVTGASTMTLHGEGDMAHAIGENEMLSVGDRLYVRGPMAQQYAPGAVIPEGSWVGIEVSPAGLASQQQAATADFSQMLDALRAAGADVEELGTQQLRDVTVEGLRATIPMRDLYAERGMTLEQAVEESLSYQPPAVRDAARAQVREQMEAMLEVPLAVTAWIDDEGLPHRLTMAMDMTEVINGAMPDGRQQTEATMTITFDILEYGIPVTVEAPPADAVFTPA